MRTERESQEPAIHARATVQVTAFDENLLPRPGTRRQQGRQDQTPRRPLKAEDEPRDGRLQQRAACSSQHSQSINHRVGSACQTGELHGQAGGAPAPDLRGSLHSFHCQPTERRTQCGRAELRQTPHWRLNTSWQLRVPKTRRVGTHTQCEPPTAILGPVTAVLAPLPRHRRTPGRAPRRGDGVEPDERNVQGGGERPSAPTPEGSGV